MPLWTVVPEEYLLAESPLENASQYEEVDYAGCKILAQAVNETNYQIVRLITTNPNDYLNQELEPGKLISCRKVFEPYRE